MPWVSIQKIVFSNLVEQCPSWEIIIHLATEEISKILMEPQGSLSCSQEPSTIPYPEPREYKSHSPILYVWDPR
jgi:hypothetical protein